MNMFSYIQNIISKIHHRKAIFSMLALLMNKIYDIPASLAILICFLQFN